MEKIKMLTPLVEMDGDEMTRILWKMIKDELILPFVDLKTEYYRRNSRGAGTGILRPAAPFSGRVRTCSLASQQGNWA